MNHLALFNGIGGFQLAASWMGWNNIASVEIDKFCNKVTKKHFPNCIQYEDIKEFNGTGYRGNIDIISGGFPCQSFSVAGKQAGDLSLWKEMLRVITEVQPPWVVAENVPGLITIKGGLLFNEVCTDLENAGYEVQPVVIPAAGKNAPHKRDRVWIVGYNSNFASAKHEISAGRHLLTSTNSNVTYPAGAGCATRDAGTRLQRHKGGFTDSIEASPDPKSPKCQSSRRTRTRRKGLTNICGEASDTDSTGRQEQWRSSPNGTQYLTLECGDWEEPWYEVAARFCRVDDGIPNRVDRLKSLGNAIVPEVAYEIFKAIDAKF
jgi:DNA (cytosine-5)-methyltransferase 1